MEGFSQCIKTKVYFHQCPNICVDHSTVIRMVSFKMSPVYRTSIILSMMYSCKVMYGCTHFLCVAMAMSSSRRRTYITLLGETPDTTSLSISTCSTLFKTLGSPSRLA